MKQARNFPSSAQTRLASFDILGNGKCVKVGWQMQDYNPRELWVMPKARAPQEAKPCCRLMGRRWPGCWPKSTGCPQGPG